MSDRMVLIHEGSIVAEGSFAELQKKRNRFVAQFIADGAEE